jgi:hypothetical protein
MKLTIAITLSLLATSVHGVSDHLWYNYNLANITDWYNEITVHPNMEPTSTYFMSNGFANGYFGIQPNSPNKTVLFSIWVNISYMILMPLCNGIVILTICT